MEYSIRVAQKAGVKKLALVHHNPLSTDAMLDDLSEKLCNHSNFDGMQVYLAKEGMEIEL